MFYVVVVFSAVDYDFVFVVLLSSDSSDIDSASIYDEFISVSDMELFSEVYKAVIMDIIAFCVLLSYYSILYIRFKRQIMT